MKKNIYLWLGGGSIYHGKKECKYRLTESCYGREPKVKNCRNYNRNYVFV